MKNHSGLQTKSLFKQYGKRWVVNDVSIEVRKGEIVGLLGPNGAGKTTTFYMITGMIKPTKGQIILDNENITEFAMYKKSRLGLGYLSQEPSIFGKLTVEDNLRLVLEMNDHKKDEREQIIENLLEDLSIKHIRHSKGYNLSGGDRR